MTTLRRRFKQKITIISGKGKDVEQLKMQGEEAANKRQEEAHGLAQEAEDWL